MVTKELLINAIIYSVIILLMCPLLGALLNKILVEILSRVFGILDRSGALFLAFANVITFVGVIHHELSHAIIAFALGAKIRKINLYKISAGSLGSVSYSPRGPLLLRSLQMSLSAAAPVFMGVITESIIYFYFHNYSGPFWVLLLIGYLALSIAVHMDMSMQDIIVYLKGVPCCFLLLVLILLLTSKYLQLPLLV